MKKIILSPWLALITLSLVLFARFLDPSFIESVRLRYFDQLIISKEPTPVPVHVINIDESALEKYGQWPFPRDVYGQIISDLYERGAGLVVFNVLMPEQDRFEQDITLSYYLNKYPVVLPILASTRTKNNVFTGELQLVGQDPEGKLVEFPGLISGVDVVNQMAAGRGTVNTFPEIDGVVRRMPLVLKAGDEIFPTLSLETVRVAAQDRLQVKIGDIGVEAVRIPSVGKLTTDSLSRIWIDWSTRPQEHSVTNLPNSFDKGIVIVGITAAGLVNPVATAAGEIWPHYLQGTLTGTILSGNSIQRHVDADTWELIGILSAGVILIFLMKWTYVGIIATVATIGGVIYASIYAYSNFLILYDSTAFAVGVGIVALHAYMAKFVSEFLQKQEIRKQFSTYMSPDLVAKLVKDPSLLQLGGEEKELTIQFSDVRGFTAISEHYGKDVKGLTSIMNRYMTAMTTVILKNRGTLDKFIGDATMSFWNAPLDETLHCKDAVKSALEMLGSLDEFNREIEKEGIPAFGMGIGINTGIVVVGNMGSEQRFDYTCLGDAVNLASRLEGQSKNYGVKIVLGPITAERVEGTYFTLELDCIAVKGKTEGVRIYTVFTKPDNQSWFAAREQHNKMLTQYRQQQWDQAIDLVNNLKGNFDNQMDDYYEIWLQRINYMRDAELPVDWDGVFRAKDK